MDLASTIAWSDLMGMAGVAVYIGSYFALQAGLIRGQGYLYASLNVVAASCVLLSLSQNFNLSSATIQVTYIAISIFGIVRFYLLSNRITFSDEERAFLETAAPGLDKIQARKLLAIGTWKTLLQDTNLTEEGKPLTHLHFMLDGTADVIVANKKIAELDGKTLAGEISCLTGMPASATVTLTVPTRCFSIEVEKLKKFFLRNQAVRHELESRFANQIGQKLMRANAAILEKS